MASDVVRSQRGDRAETPQRLRRDQLGSLKVSNSAGSLRGTSAGDKGWCWDLALRAAGGSTSISDLESWAGVGGATGLADRPFSPFAVGKPQSRGVSRSSCSRSAGDAFDQVGLSCSISRWSVGTGTNRSSAWGSAFGPGSRCATPGLLSGICPVTELQNVRGGCSMDRVLTENHTQPRAANASPLSRVASAPGRFAGTELPDLVDFESLSEGALASLADLKRRLETFEPSNGRDALFAGKSAKGASGSLAKRREEADGDGGDGPSFADRLDAYKMQRRWEPELQPTQAVPPHLCAPPRPVLDAGQVRFNQSSKAIDMWRPQISADRRKRRQHERAERSLGNTGRGEVLQAASVSRHAAELERKRQQGESAKAAKKPQSKAAGSMDNQSKERWLTILALVSFLNEARDEVAFTQMVGKDLPSPEAASVARVGSEEGSPKRCTMSHRKASLIQDNMRSLQFLGDPVLVGRLSMFVKIIRRRQQVRARRKNALVAMTSLTSWKLGGRCFRSLRHFAHQIRLMQRWWRMVQRRLHEARDKVVKRWERLERAELARELNKAEPLPGAKEKNAPPKLSLEEKIQLHFLDDSVRLSFIENELRARRYALLPAIQVWEMDCENWRNEVNAWREIRRAHIFVGSDAYLRMQDLHVTGALNNELNGRYEKQDTEPPTFLHPQHGGVIVFADGIWKLLCRQNTSVCEFWRNGILECAPAGRWSHRSDQLQMIMVDTGPGFRFPPARPSYMPAAHGEAGEAGNLEILDMWRRARKCPDNWTQIKTKAGQKHRASIQAADSEVLLEKDGASCHLDDDDLAAWGQTPLPGLADSGKPETARIGHDPGMALQVPDRVEGHSLR